MVLMRLLLSLVLLIYGLAYFLTLYIKDIGLDFVIDDAVWFMNYFRTDF